MSRAKRAAFQKINTPKSFLFVKSYFSEVVLSRMQLYDKRNYILIAKNQ